MLEIKKDTLPANLPNILVVGIGGAGNNAVNRMLEEQNFNVNYIAINTDLQVLQSVQTENRLQIGPKLTNGFGAGGNPDIGSSSATESEDELRAILAPADMIILTCGMGGGTGTGATPIIAKLCQELQKLTIAVVTKPFYFEGPPRCTLADNGIEMLKNDVDMLIVVKNDNLLTLSEKALYLENAFQEVDVILTHVIHGITNIIFNRGIINLDFNDLKSLLAQSGVGHLGMGIVDQDGSIMDAVKQALNSPLLDSDITGASRILLNTSGRVDLKELNEAIEYVRQITATNANIMWGTVTDKEENDKIIVTLIATGLPSSTDLQKETNPLPLPHTPLTPATEDFSIEVPAFLRKKHYYKSKTIME